MKHYRWLWRLLLLFSGIGLMFVLTTAFEQAKGKTVLQGIRQIKRGETQAVSLSERVTRVLTPNTSQAETNFRETMKRRGWDFICYYGRSALYRSQQQEVLVRKTPLVGGFCIYELMDESYFKYMKSQIREVA